MRAPAGPLLALVLLLTICPALASAQPGTRLLVEGGLALPMAPEEFTDFWNAGFGLGVGVEFGLGATVSMWALGEFNRMGLDEEKADSYFYTFGPRLGVDGGDVNLFGLMAGVRLRADRQGFTEEESSQHLPIYLGLTYPSSSE